MDPGAKIDLDCPRTGVVAVLLCCAVLACPKRGHAQAIQLYFPQGQVGYDQDIGVTVLTRRRSDYETSGISLGSFTVRPNLDQTFFYDSSLNGLPDSATGGSTTAGAVSVSSNWSRNSLGLSAGFSHEAYFELPRDSYTDWNVGVAGGYTIYDSQLEAAYSHEDYHQLGNTIGALRSQTPFLDQTDTARLDYTFTANRLSITPEFNASAYNFGPATVMGVRVDQSFLDRDVFSGGLTARYSLSDEGGLVAVLRGTKATYPNALAGQPSDDSSSILALGGIDYQAKGPWRYGLLAGVEVRMFRSPLYPSHTAPILEGNATWTPTGLITLSAVVSRAIEDPQTAETNGYVLTQGLVTVDYELRRNVFLQARGGASYAEYLHDGGTQDSFSIGGGVNWLLNRNVRLSLDYNFTRQTNSLDITNAAAQAASGPGNYSQSAVLLTLHLAL